MWPVIAEIPLPFQILGHDHLPIRAFGLMMVLSLLSAHAVWVRKARREGFPQPAIDNFFLVLVVAIVAGARLLYVITNWREFEGDWTGVFAVHRGGMVFYGSFLAAAVALTLFARHYGISVLRFLDACAAPTGIGLFVGRIGCLLVGDDYGKRCSPDFSLAIKFPSPWEDGSLYGIAIPKNNGNLAGAMQGEWLHPAQIYMMANGLFLFFVLQWLGKRRTFHGQIVAAFFMLYAVNRSVIEFFRGDDDRGFIGPLSTSQFISIFVFLGGLVVYAANRSKTAGVGPV